MSLAQMQTALARIVRYPTEDLGALFGQFTLSDSEKAAIRELASNRELGKFGLGIQEMRWEIASARFPLLRKAVPDESLTELFADFEPLADRVSNRDVAWEFLRFLEVDEEARATVNRLAKPYVWDFIAFEKAQLEILRDEWYGTDPLTEGSPLASRAVYLLDLAHDLPEYLSALQNGIEAEPTERQSLALLIGADVDPGYRLFELDGETFTFLRQALGGIENLELPASHGALVEAGVCRG